MQTKMIVTDLDNTLLQTKKIVSDYTADVFRTCQSKGLTIAFATARPERATKQFQEKITPDYVIADNGATIHYGESVVRCLTIPQNTRDALLTSLLSCEEVTLITVEAVHCVYTNYDGPPWDVNWNIIYTDFSDRIFPDTPKISVECKDKALVTRILQNYPELHLYSNTGEDWYQITCKDSSKTKAIQYIARSLGFDLQNIVAFGDDYNDVEMLQRCGIGVAVANAIQEAKTVADCICDTNDHDGVAKWLAENILHASK